MVGTVDYACSPQIAALQECSQSRGAQFCNDIRLEVMVCAANIVCKPQFFAFERCSTELAGRKKGETAMNCPHQTGAMINCVHDRYLSAKSLLKKKEAMEELELERKKKERKGYVNWKEKEEKMWDARDQWKEEKAQEPLMKRYGDWVKSRPQRL